MFTTNASENIRGREFFKTEKLQAFPTYEATLNCSFLKTMIHTVSKSCDVSIQCTCVWVDAKYFIFVTLL